MEEGRGGESFLVWRVLPGARFLKGVLQRTIVRSLIQRTKLDLRKLVHSVDGRVFVLGDDRMGLFEDYEVITEVGIFTKELQLGEII